jgi:hypothetical protein
MAAEVRVEVHHRAPRCLLGLFDAAAADLVDWSEFDAEAGRWSVEIRGLSREPRKNRGVVVFVGVCMKSLFLRVSLSCLRLSIILCSASIVSLDSIRELTCEP